MRTDRSAHLRAKFNNRPLSGGRQFWRVHLRLQRGVDAGHVHLGVDLLQELPQYFGIAQRPVARAVRDQYFALKAGEKLTAQAMPAFYFAPRYGLPALREGALRRFGIHHFFQI